jgi:excisionase family DNA binding protein
MKAPDWITEALSDLPKILTAEEAVGALRTTRRNLSRLVASGRIHAVRPAEAGRSRLLIPRSSVEHFLRSLEGRAT